MSFEVKADSLKGGTYRDRLDRLPGTCPCCHEAVVPVLVAARTAGNLGAERIDIAFQCPKLACQSVFVAQYDYKSTQYNLGRVPPLTAPPPPFSQTVTQLSPSFGRIYSQAVAAEQSGFNELVGPGLRKGLEFLVKDFAMSLAPGDAEKLAIARLPLAACVSSYIKDPLIAEVAHRALWLGNDEVHYRRVWADKDVQDIKHLIRLVSAWIESHLLASRYVDEMPRR